MMRKSSLCELCGVDCLKLPLAEWPRGWVSRCLLSGICRDQTRRITTPRAEAATSITTLAANPAGTHGFSSSCNIHHKTKKSAAAAAEAATIYADADGAERRA